MEGEPFKVARSKARGGRLEVLFFREPTNLFPIGFQFFLKMKAQPVSVFGPGLILRCKRSLRTE